MPNRKASSFLLFLIGTFSMTQIRVIGSIGISELFMFVVAPFVFLQDMKSLRRDGFMPIIWLSTLTCISCIVSSVLNSTEFPLLLRGFASPYSIFAISIVLHRLLANNLGGLKWVLLGWALSQTINVFYFQRAVEVYNYADGLAGYGAADMVMSSPIFWIGRLGPWASLPITGWYLHVPIAYMVLEPLLFAIFALFSTESGRAGALCCFATLYLLLMTRKHRGMMMKMSKRFIWVCLVGLLVLFAYKTFYERTAASGMLGDKAQEKYESQTHGQKGFLALIMGGRSEFFIGLMAALRRPVWGYGPWPLDTEDIAGEFLTKYGNEEDYIRRLKNRSEMIRLGYSMRIAYIPTHSHIISGWVWYGIIGAILWVYVLYLIFVFLRKDIAAIPGWFGYYAVMLPQCTWDIMFSPFGGRLVISLLITCLLISSAVRRGFVNIPADLVVVK